MVTTPTNLDLCCPDARAKPADLQRSSTFISCIGAVWVGLEFFRSLPANSEERSDIDPFTNVQVRHGCIFQKTKKCKQHPRFELQKQSGPEIVAAVSPRRSSGRG